MMTFASRSTSYLFYASSFSSVYWESVSKYEIGMQSNALFIKSYSLECTDTSWKSHCMIDFIWKGETLMGPSQELNIAWNRQGCFNLQVLSSFPLKTKLKIIEYLAAHDPTFPLTGHSQFIGLFRVPANFFQIYKYYFNITFTKHLSIMILYLQINYKCFP